LSNPTRGNAQRSRTILLALFGLAVLALLAPAAGSAAKKKHKKDPTVTVMTRNVYLGADLGPAISANSICGAVDAAGTILNDVDASDFPARAKLLAAEIKSSKADLVGLQEVALWREQTPSDYTTTPATTVRYDFLQSLLDELKAAGSEYTVAVVQDEFDQELPANVDHNLETGNGPLGGSTGPTGCGADKDGRLTMRDAILVKSGSKVNVSNPKMGHFTNRYSVNLGGVVPINVDRGWVSVDGKIAGKKMTRGAKFHFVNAHLEAFGDPAIREAQARELFVEGGPMATKRQLIFVGDINSGSPEDKIGPPFTTAGDEGAYNALTGDFGLFNLGTRQTCCYSGTDAATIGSYRFDHTVDHVMVKPKVKQLKAKVTGNDPTVVTPSNQVASDHGGLWSKLQLKKIPKKK
jgi:endonuclease/exonuclease/phosphatase family metal-dependent hydrolase